MIQQEHTSFAPRWIHRIKFFRFPSKSTKTSWPERCLESHGSPLAKNRFLRYLNVRGLPGTSFGPIGWFGAKKKRVRAQLAAESGKGSNLLELWGLWRSAGNFAGAQRNSAGTSREPPGNLRGTSGEPPGNLRGPLGELGALTLRLTLGKVGPKKRNGPNWT